jgi:anti-anti-sigma regulatory factor
MYGLRKSLGFADVPNSDYLVRVSRIRSGACKLKDRIAECLLLCWKAMLPLPKPDSSIEIRKIDTFDNSFAQLADRVSQERVLRLNKGQAYLNWRYFHCPGRKYKVFRASDGNARGAVVTGVIGEPSEEGWIVDLLCSSRDGACALALLLKALKELEAKGVSRIYAFATQPAARKWLRRLGFLPTGRTPRFTYKIYGQKVDRNVLAQSPWDFWHGDGDVELYM